MDVGAYTILCGMCSVGIPFCLRTRWLYKLLGHFHGGEWWWRGCGLWEVTLEIECGPPVGLMGFDVGM